MSKPKILFILPTDIFGGAERVTYNLLKAISSFEEVLLTQEAMVPFYSSLGLPVRTFEQFGCKGPDISFKSMMGYAKAIRDLSRIERPDIIFGVMHFASVFSLAAKDLFFLPQKIVASIHGNASAYYSSSGREKTVIERILISYFRMRARHIIVPSAGVKDDLTQNFGINDDRVKVIHNGFDLDEIRKGGLEEIPSEKDCPWISMAARFNTQKDFLTLLKAFKRIREHVRAKLLLIGEGDLRPTIEEWISGLNLSNDVLLTGFQANPYKYIAKSDVFVLSSFLEGFPSVLIEAMALGVPVVSADCPSGPGEIIKNGENGLLVPVSDPGKLAEACLTVLNDPAFGNRLIEGGLKRAEYFSVRNMSREYNEYFADLIK